MKTSARAAMVGVLVGWVALGPAPAPAASFADLPQDWTEVSLLRDRLSMRAPKAARPEPPPYGIMEAPEAADRRLHLVIDSGPLRLVASASEMFRVSPGGLAQLGPSHMKEMERRGPVGPLSLAPSATNASGLEILTYEPRAPAKLGDAHLVSGALTRHPDGAVQILNFYVNDPALADLPAARRLIADMVASLKPGPRQLVTGTRVMVGGSNLVLVLPPGYTAYRQVGTDFDVHWVEHLVALGQPSGRLGIYSGHHPQAGRHPANARMEGAVLFGADAQWYVWEGPANLANAPRFHREAYVSVPGTPLTRHVFFYAITEAESADLQRIAESAAFPVKAP